MLSTQNKSIFYVFLVLTAMVLLFHLLFKGWKNVIIKPSFPFFTKVSLGEQLTLQYTPPLSLILPHGRRHYVFPVNMTVQLPVVPKMLSSGLPDKEDLTWKEQPGGKQYFFSAFYDDREGGHVRIVSLVDRETKPPGFCRVWFREAGKTGLGGDLSSNDSIVRPAKLERNPKRGKYSASLYHCDVKGLPKPLAVSLVEDRNSAHTNSVPILKVIDKSRPSKWDANKLRRKIGVCVETPLFEYSNFMRLIEFVEVYRTLGAEHFTLYNYTGDPVMNPVIRAYVQQGIMTLIPWNLPPNLRVNSVGNEATEGVHYYAELSSIQDCLYRTMYEFKYVVFVDTDELIVPRKQNDLYAMLESLPQDRAGYAFAKKEFIISPATIDTYPAVKGKLEARLLRYRPACLLTSRRSRKIHSFSKRCCYKTIVKPEKVWLMDVHWIERATESTFNAGGDLGSLHHYRQHFMGSGIITDASIFRFGEKILENIDKAVQYVRHTT